MTVKKRLRLPEGWLELLVDLPTDGRSSRLTCEEGFIKGFLEHPQGAGTNIFLENGAGLRVTNTAEDLLQQLEAQGVPFEDDDDDGPGEPVEEAPVPLGKGHDAAYYFVIRVLVASTGPETVMAFERSIENARYPNHAIMPTVVRTAGYAGPTGILHAHVLVIDHDHVGAEGVRQMLQQARRPPYEGLVIYKDARNIGAWHDDHPLNQVATMRSAFEDIFGVKLP